MLIAVEVGEQKLKQKRRSAFMGSVAGIEFWQTTAIAAQMIFKAFAHFDRQLAGRVLYLPRSNSSPQQANKLTPTAAQQIQAQPRSPTRSAPHPERKTSTPC